MRTIRYVYRIRFADGSTREFEAVLDAGSLALQASGRPEPPAWTALEVHQCPNCPLAKDRHPRCPAAAALADPVGVLADHVSHEEVDMTVEGPNRTTQKRTTLQKGASSLIGLLMATSGCPVLDRLRPLAETHLPFASFEETAYRLLSMYLLAQYFEAESGGRPDWELGRLREFFNGLHQVNEAFCRRLSSVRGKDASLNAVSILSSLADMTGLSVAVQDVDRLRALFSPPSAGGSPA